MGHEGAVGDLVTGSSRPENQSKTFSSNSWFSSATGEFIPLGLRSGPTSCAVNIAASPKTATRPSLTRNAAPWHHPPMGTRGVLESHRQASVGMIETTSSPRTRRAWGLLFASTRKADPVKVATESTVSLWVLPSVVGLAARDPSPPVLSGRFWVE